MAVYTEISDEEVRALLADYDIGELRSFRGIAEGVENTNYILHTNKNPFILTLYEKRVDPADLPFFLSLLDFLNARGIACPAPVQDRRGEALKTLSGRPAALFTFLEGVWVRRPEVRHCAEVGQAMARLHAASADFPRRRPNSLSLSGWPPLVERCRARADEVAEGLGAEIDAEMAHLAAHWPRELPTGVIHADLFPDNVFFIDGAVSGLIDFYFACTDMLAYDVAIALNAWCFERDASFNVTKARALLGQYRKVRPFTEQEFRALPTLCRGAALRFLLTRLHDWLYHPPGAFVAPKDPLEYRQKLRFHRSIESASAYGL